MRVSGTVIIDGMQLPTRCETTATGVTIDYNIECSISEIKEAIDLIDIIPAKLDVLAELARKIETYREEFKLEPEDSILDGLSQKEQEEKANRERIVDTLKAEGKL